MIRTKPLVCALLLTAAIVHAAPAQGVAGRAEATTGRAFAPGERLTYDISWSRLVKAGVAVMDVGEGFLPDGRRVYTVRSRTNSVGLLDALYPVRDVVESTIDFDDLCSHSYRIRISHGNRKRERSLAFDRRHGAVRYFNGSGAPKVLPVPECVQDALSSLYYLRTLKEFAVGKPIRIDVHDADKTWAVELIVLGRERVETPAGTFDTIKIKTYPRYEGVFMHKGEIFLWLTDDERRIPVLMKSAVAIGSIVAALSDIQDGRSGHGFTERTQAAQ